MMMDNIIPNTLGKCLGCIFPNMTLQSVTASGPPRRQQAGPGFAPADSGPTRNRARYNFEPARCDCLFSGHTHVQALVDFGEKKYCNPGSVGQPRDGDPRTAYAIVDGVDIFLYRVSYDIDQTVFAMKQAGYDAFYYSNLYIGAQIGGRIDRIKVIKKGNK